MLYGYIIYIYIYIYIIFVENQQTLERKQMLKAQMDDHEQFFKELRDKEKKFDAVAKYFGRGLFTQEDDSFPKY